MKISANDILRLTDTPSSWRLAAVLREEICPTKVLHLFACSCGENALRIANVTEERCWSAIAIKRRWVEGKATNEELSAACFAACDAEACFAAAFDAAPCDADRDAAVCDAACLAACATARVSARDAACSAAWADRSARILAASAACDASYASGRFSAACFAACSASCVSAGDAPYASGRISAACDEARVSAREVRVIEAFDAQVQVLLEILEVEG